MNCSSWAKPTRQIAIITAISALIPTYFQLVTSAPVEGMIVLGVAMGLVVIIFTLDYIMSNYRNKINQLENLTERVKKLEDKLDVHTMVKEFDKRISILESKHGQIDPRIVALILLIIVVLIYLRTIGIF